ncbi:hypothetical protein [Streptomyces sp. NBC_00842]|uniref:hypothetical protein n=1 Tax=Streptomyces sp. NBC_00842 TaxID=2975848 RepID=UPI002F90D809|nr:hypothetical protein OH821_45020 [Streptomyces sp. NBC_00842]
MPDLTNTQLQAAVTKLAKNSTRTAEAIHAWGQALDDEAKDTARVAEGIAGMGVDVDTVSETRELSQTLTGIQAAATAYSSSANNTAKAATASHEQIRITHDGFQEAYRRADADPRNLSRDWLEQE